MADRNDRNILSSWKEIATYLNCSVRTCTRWEEKYGLPIHRIDRERGTTVYAYKSELDRWIATKAKKRSQFLDIIPFRLNALKIVFLGFLITAVLLSLFFIPKIFIDRIPSDFHIENSTLYALNAEGKELWKFETGVENLSGDEYYKKYFQYRRTEEIEFRKSLLPHIIIKDLTNDGKPEIVFSIQTQDEFGEGELFCFDYKGNQLWKFTGGKVLKFGQKVISQDYRLYGFDVFDMNGDGNLEIAIISAHRIRFPTQLVILDSQGRKLGEYWNSGRLSDLQFMDLNEDGREEILVSGCNNEYKKGVLIVFDTAHINGSSPQTDEKSICKELKSGTEKYYILFPRTDVDILEAEVEAINIIDNLKNRRLSLLSLTSQILFELNYDLELEGITLSHAFRQKHKWARLEGKIKSEINEEYEQSLKEDLLYYDGNGWVSEPTMTAYWKNNHRNAPMNWYSPPDFLWEFFSFL